MRADFGGGGSLVRRASSQAHGVILGRVVGVSFGGEDLSATRSGPHTRVLWRAFLCRTGHRRGPRPPLAKAPGTRSTQAHLLGIHSSAVDSSRYTSCERKVGLPKKRGLLPHCRG